jgi:hypothetical protein
MQQQELDDKKERIKQEKVRI